MPLPPLECFDRTRAALFIAEDLASLREDGDDDPELAAIMGRLVTAIMDAELIAGAAHGTALRAVRLAGDQQLTGAIPALVRCLVMLDETHPVAHAALDTLERIGRASVDELLRAFEASGTRSVRTRIAEALKRTGVRDERIRHAFARMLDDDPVSGAGYLTEYGDPNALPALDSALERCSAAVRDVGDLQSAEAFLAVASAICELRGPLPRERRALLSRAVQIRERLRQ